MNAIDLRHSLRTPLNHILGYAEMLQEDNHGEGNEADRSSRTLRDLIKDAKELVQLIQNAFKSDSDSVAENDLQDFRGLLLPRVRRLAALAADLSTILPPESLADAAKIEFAVGRLFAFAENRPDSMAGLSESVPESPDAASERNHANLLIIDDNADNRDILRRHLERQDYGVAAAADGPKGLELLTTGNFELVLLDVRMPGMDGFEVLKQMKLAPHLQETPVVMISALDETSSVVRCIQMGAEDYLMKPFDPVLLSARVGASLEKKRLRDGERRRTQELQNALDELRRTQGQLLVQEKLASLGALTAGIAHEIKNPLNFVTNFASASVEMIREIREILPAEEKSAPLMEKLGELEQYVTKIDEHGKRADRIVRGMLLHSRGKSGKPEFVEVNDLLRDAMNLTYHGLRAQDRDFNLRLESAFDPAAGAVRAVPQELSRVFLNILNNACYAAWERKKTEGDRFQPTVSVQTKNCGSAVEIRIRDNGTGIPAGIRRKIFDPFFTTKPAGAGTGLGLSISHDIVVSGHHGTIGVESEPDHGTVFIVTLPRESA